MTDSLDQEKLTATDETMALARNIVNQIADLYSERLPSPDWVPVRQSTNDVLDQFVVRLLLAAKAEVWVEGVNAYYDSSSIFIRDVLAKNPYNVQEV